MNTNAVILRDIPKEEARIDLFKLPIQGGFRGFCSDFPLIGWHYVSVKVEQHSVGFWCYLSPNEAVVRVFDQSQGFIEDTPESTQRYRQLALSGAMHQALVPYPPALFAHWFGLVSQIDQDNFPPQVYSEDSGTGSRLDKAFLGTHAGRVDSFMAEFQFAFVRWWVSLDTINEDKAGFERWRHLLLSCYNAGEDRIRGNGDLFGSLVDTLIRQFSLLPAGWFREGSFLTEQVDYLIEDLQDSGIPELAQKGRVLAGHMETMKRNAHD